jgi:integrase
MEDFIDHLGDRAKIPLSAVSVADVRSFRDALAKEGLSSVTVNQVARKVLSVPFEAARRLGYITVNPCHGVEALKDSVDVERDVFTLDQVSALCKAADGDWQGVILAGYFTGMRLGDITELEWRAIDLDAGLLKVKTRKTGKTVVIPLASELADWLKSQPLGIAKAPVFKSIHGKRGTGRNGLSMQFKKIMEQAGIKGRVLRSGEGKGRNTSSLSFHSLRHSFNSALANAGVSQEVRQKLTGHASAAMNDHYTHHEIDILKAAMAKMPAIKGGRK